MNLGDLIRQAAEADFITGIYNYCDRWCERCPLTSRCLLFHQEQANQSIAADLKGENQKFWDQLGESLHDATDVLAKTATRWDVDLAQDGAKHDEELTQRLDEESLPSLAHLYAMKVEEWFSSATEDFEAKGDELRCLDGMDIADSDPAAEAEDIADCVEIVRWYQFQIRSKLMRAYAGVSRALSSRASTEEDSDKLVEDYADRSFPISDIEAYERELYDALDGPEWDDDDSEDDDGFVVEAIRDAGSDGVSQSSGAATDDEDPFAEFDDAEDPEFEAALRAEELADANGSAKVALIGMDRSIAAWTRLRPHLPDRADELLDVLVMIDRLRRATEAQFPEARSFYRPGFDD